MVLEALQWQLRATPNGHWWKFSSIMPPYYCWTMLSTYDIHNKISFLGHSEAIGFWPYILAFKATAPKILWSKDLNFLDSKVSYIYQHDPTISRSRSANTFLFSPTLRYHTLYKTSILVFELKTACNWLLDRSANQWGGEKTSLGIPFFTIDFECKFGTSVM